MEDWKHNIKMEVEMMDAQHRVSKKELGSKWRVVEEGLKERKLKPFWISISGIAAGVALLIVVFVVYSKKNYNFNSLTTKKQESAKTSQNSASSVEEGPLKKENSGVVLHKKNGTPDNQNPISSNSISPVKKNTDSFFSHSIPPVALIAAEKTIAKKPPARSRQKSRKSIAISGSATNESNVVVKQKTGINMMDYVDLTEKGRHEGEKREDKNTIIKF